MAMVNEGGVVREENAEEAAARLNNQAVRDAVLAAQAARDAGRAARLTKKPDVPADANSILALKAEVEMLTAKVNDLIDELLSQ